MRGYSQVDHPDVIRPEKKVYTTKCCCCISLRAGTLALMVLDLIFSILPFTSVDYSDADNVFTQSKHILAFSIVMIILGVVFTVVGLIGVLRYNTRLVQVYTYWLFAAMAMLVMWKLIYYASGLAHDDVETICRNAAGGDPVVVNPKPDPNGGDTVESCTEVVYATVWIADIPATAINLMISTYFAVCVLSYYHEMYNNETAALIRQAEADVSDAPQFGVRVVYDNAHHAPHQPATELATAPSAPSPPRD